MFKFIFVSPLLFTISLFVCWGGTSIKDVYDDCFDGHNSEECYCLSFLIWLGMFFIIGAITGFIVWK